MVTMLTVITSDETSEMGANGNALTILIKEIGTKLEKQVEMRS